MARKKREERPEDEVVDAAAITPQYITDSLREEYGADTASIGQITEARDYISTQCATLDFALGRPGIPTAGITNIFGDEASGKSTLGYHLLAETQRRNGIAVLCDYEGAYDFDRGKRIGIKFDDLVMITSPTLDGAFDAIESAMRLIRRSDPNRLICIVLDSLAGAPTKASLEAAYGDILPADKARLVSGSLPKLHAVLRETNTALVLVNQLRAKITMGPVWGGPKETQTAENSLKFWSSVRIHTAAFGAPVGDKDAPSGIEVIAHVKKNKCAPPFRQARFIINFWDGIDTAAAKLTLATKLGIVTTGGGWYQYDGNERFRAGAFASTLAKFPEIDEALAKAPLLWMHEEE